MSGGSLLNKGLPYDAEIEYLEATGTQWIDTGFKATNGCIFDFEAMWIVYESNIVGSHNPRGNLNNGYNRNLVSISNVNKIKFLKCNAYTQGFTYPCSLNTKYHIYFNNIGVNYIGTLDRNTVVNSTTNEIVNPVNNVVMFLTQYSNTPDKGRIYNCKLYDSTSTLVRDFIPVRVDTTGYLYDKVSGQLFGNQGTGSFILGNDI